MIALLLRRLIHGSVTVLIATACAFVLIRFVGDPVATFAPQDATQQDRDALARRLGLETPLPEQFGRFVVRAIRCDFGSSYRHRRPVADLIVERLPASAELAAAAMVIAVGLGVPGGVLAAARHGGAVARALNGFAVLMTAMPSFVLGLVLIAIFGVALGWLPTHGRGEVIPLGFWSTGLATSSGRAALILPAATLAAFQLALLLRLTRAQTMAGLASDLVVNLRARGLGEGRVLIHHVVPLAAAPIVTLIGLQTGTLLAFSAITEQVFQWPGLGLLFLQAVTDGDIPVIAAYLCFVAALFVAVNLIVDLACRLIDPRWLAP